MLFPTLEFILFFGTVLALNTLVFDRAGWRKALLLLASYGFYAAWDPRFLGLMIAVSATAYLGGLAVTRPKLRKLTIWLSLIALLGLLGFFKYFNFFALSLQQLLESAGLGRDFVWLSVILPVGISFYIFQAISYIIDVDRDVVTARKNPVDIFLYISFFPQLVAGPIVRASVFLPQIDAPTLPTPIIRAEAVVLILTGLFKKMIVANYLAVGIVDPFYALPDGQNAVTAVAAFFAYGIQIYCDFSGYSDIAIGIALLLGYRFPTNFRQPYSASSLRAFWQRWHISLSTWIRDYVYIPLGGNQGHPRRQMGVLVGTMTLAGLWHGAGWNFLLWGFFHGVGLAYERRVGAAQGWRGVVLVTLFVFALWIPFRADSFGDLLQVFGAFTRLESFAPVDISAFGLSLIAVGFAMNYLPERGLLLAQTSLARLPTIVQALVLIVGVWTCFATAQEGMAPFIYFQF
ncbi:alginate O-acetyltransferase [Jannaschia pagri]|uniref:Probable alginate O-acetylase AlgI n=1 Tax=Jannaschia pagri TaxID=2829797 RepID=A0ABQ4NID9_9RHOB|nr:MULTISPECIES: MBOAT family O-acyltransferase [unclassified Jannaschia]GIT89704.1 alginate O-acetyltransferase [Jannaschia sp. AI_61]GIT94188.1 alginate O-acetyltransferase [Jannaschia sp. AI_62]